MRIVLMLFSIGIGFRCISRVLLVLKNEIGFNRVPHWTTCRLWVLKLGYHEIAFKTLEKAKDWAACLDFTVEVGALKCLLILGVRLSALKGRADLTLTHKDIQVLGICPTAQSSGEFVCTALEEAEKRAGHPFASTLLDRGSDVTKGAHMYQECRSTVLIHDISHTIANLLERRLKNNEHWKKFCTHLAETRLAVQQTHDLAALMPASQRAKARFMNADILMDWHSRFQENGKAGHFDSIPKERIGEYFGWLSELEPHINCWKQMVQFGESVKARVTANGFSHKHYYALEDLVCNFQPDDTPSDVIDFMGDVMEAVWEEVEKLKPRQIALGDSRFIENVFGMFKQTDASRFCGITISVLGIATRFANKNVEDVQIAMERTTVKQLFKWGIDKFGNTLARMRRKFFPHKKRKQTKGNYRELKST